MHSNTGMHRKEIPAHRKTLKPSSYVNTHMRPSKSRRRGQTTGRVNNILNPSAAHSPRLPLPSLNKTQRGGTRDNSQHLRLIGTWESRSLWAFQGRPLSLSSSRGSEERREGEACQAGEGCQSPGWSWLLGPSLALILCCSAFHHQHCHQKAACMSHTHTHCDKKWRKTDGCQFSGSEWKRRRVSRRVGQDPCHFCGGIVHTQRDSSDTLNQTNNQPPAKIFTV